eukprot:CAMPEP_0196576750 /NCGR_PEP_ID=MMETSP1081-20130531/5933_1 /TAXON_ID=36882 /ORGANISM="Pyramimonas amylifera, Strain CCMP720" /LENGTH=306 /DNA_ID=CAMNT_0041895441 /DNA_START=247 /DNA_END=1167 /DNA_ORIENTATION=+
MDIQYLSIVGERHSGTNWLKVMLQDTFDTTVQNGYTRWKHWFQVNRPDELLDYRFQDPLDKKLAIVIARNPYDWLMAMRRTPWHSSSHYRLPMEKFVRLEWAIPPSNLESNFENLSRQNRRACSLAEGFDPGELIPCYFEDYVPGKARPLHHDIYETHPSTNEIFKNVVAMRTAKLMWSVKMAEWAPRIEFVRYEDLLHNGGQGARKWLSKMMKKYNLNCRQENVASSTRNAKEGCENYIWSEGLNITTFKGQRKSSVNITQKEEHMFYNLRNNHKDLNSTLFAINPLLDEKVEACWGYSLRKLPI